MLTYQQLTSKHTRTSTPTPNLHQTYTNRNNSSSTIPPITSPPTGTPTPTPTPELFLSALLIVLIVDASVVGQFYTKRNLSPKTSLRAPYRSSAILGFQAHAKKLETAESVCEEPRLIWNRAYTYLFPPNYPGELIACVIPYAIPPVSGNLEREQSIVCTSYCGKRSTYPSYWFFDA